MMEMDIQTKHQLVNLCGKIKDKILIQINNHKAYKISQISNNNSIITVYQLNK